jgi:hypothetical protein
VTWPPFLGQRWNVSSFSNLHFERRATSSRSGRLKRSSRLRIASGSLREGVGRGDHSEDGDFRADVLPLEELVRERGRCRGAALQESRSGTEPTILPSAPSHANGNGVFGVAAVGSDRGSEPTGGPWAVMWPTPSGSMVSLHPIGYSSSRAHHIYEVMQVGDGSVDQTYHALLWRGTAESVVDLHPPVFHLTTANAVTETSQAGARIRGQWRIPCAFVAWNS